jgi:type IV pilus assembly protein PilW
MDKSACAEGCRGLTLVELLVALAVSAILGIAIFITMGFGFHQDMVSGDLTQMNDSARGALLLLTRDLQSAGFMQTVDNSSCALTLAYDSNQGNPYLQFPPVSAASQASVLPLQSGKVGYDLGYGTQALVLTLAPSVPQYVQQSRPPVAVVQFGTTQSSSGQGAVASTQLPVSAAGAGTLKAGDMAYLAVPMNGGVVCLRVPIVNVGPVNGQGSAYVDSKSSNLMPSTGYKGYSTQIPASYGTLSNSNLQHSYLIDLGQGGSPSLEVHEYWIAPSGTMPFPVLQRSTFDAMSDSLVSQQPIAPGAVSLQMLFGVVPAGTTPGTTDPTWKTWGNVQAGDQVVTVALALVMRSLHADPGYTAPSSIAVPSPVASAAAPDAFVPYAPPAADIHHHFSVYTTQVWLRNEALASGATSTPASTPSSPATPNSTPTTPPSSPGTTTPPTTPPPTTPPPTTNPPSGGGGNQGQGNGDQGNGNQGQGNGDQGNGKQGNGNQGNGDQGNGNQGNGNQGNGNQGNGNQGNGNQGNGGQGNG